MANPMKGEVALEVGGKKYIFVIGTYALVALERRVKMPWPKFIEGAIKGEWGYEQVLLVAQAALLRHHKSMTEEDVANLMDEATPQKIMETVSECLQLMQPMEEAAVQSDEPRPMMSQGNGQPLGKSF